MRIVKNGFIALIALLIGALNPHTVSANTGKVIFSFGKVTLERDGGDRVLRRGAVVQSGDKLNTGPRGRAHVRMNDGTMISLRPGTQFEIEEYVNNETATPAAVPQAAPSVVAKTQSRSAFRLLKGGFRTITGLIAKRNRSAYRVATPVATIGIRGTDFTAIYCAGDCGGTSGVQDGLYVGVDDGGVAIQNDAGFLDIGNDEYAYVSGSDTPPSQTYEMPAAFFTSESDGGVDDDAPVDDSSPESNKEGEGEAAENKPGENEGEAGQNEAGEAQSAQKESANGDGGQGGDGAENGADSESAKNTPPSGKNNPPPGGDERPVVNTDRRGANEQPPAAGNPGNTTVQVTQGQSNGPNGEQNQDPSGEVAEPEIDDDIFVVTPTRFVGTSTGPISGVPIASVVRVNENNTVATDQFGRLTQFVAAHPEGGLASYNIGSASEPSVSGSSTPVVGIDSVTNLRWGRWSDGIAQITRQDGSVQQLDLTNQSLHWVAGPQSVDRPAIPSTGSASYQVTGFTAPTDNRGNVGTLSGNASFTADFGASTIQHSLALSINGEVWNATDNNGTISNGRFGGQYDSVTTTLPSTDASGGYTGFFADQAAGAALTYGLTADPLSSAQSPVSVSGAVVFGDPQSSP